MREKITLILDQLSDDQIAVIYDEYLATLTPAPLPSFKALVDKICDEPGLEMNRTNGFEHMVFEMIKDEICRRFCNVVF